MSQEMVAVKEVAPGGVWVEGVQQSSCGACAARKGCGHASLAEMGKPVRLWIPTSQPLREGQTVVLDLPDGALAASATTLYGAPLAGLIAGAVCGQAAGSDTTALLGGIAGLAAGFIVARTLAHRFRNTWQPRIVSVCNLSGS